ncbi:MAG: hypothetical protein AAGU74_14070 [Bacillota bacterium]
MDDTGCMDLCAAIMRQAVDDYFALKRGRKIPGESVKGLLAFFRGEWAQALCGDVDPVRLLRRLEDEYVSKNEIDRASVLQD